MFEDFDAFLLRWIPEFFAVLAGLQVDAAVFATPRAFGLEVPAIDRNHADQRAKA